MRLSESDRSFIDESLAQYGSAWSEGVAGLERDFEIEVTVKRRKYILQLQMRSPAGFCTKMTITRPKGDLSQKALALPPGVGLSAQELAQVEEALRRESVLFLLEPLNSSCLRLDLKQGFKSLCEGPLDLCTHVGEDGQVLARPARSLIARRRGSWVCLYVLAKEAWDDPFCLWLAIEGEAMKVAGACWGDIPMPKGGLLDRETFAFLDRAMRENGDFGVYGSVAGGLEDLMEFMEVTISFREAESHGDVSSWWIRATPRDGHGHFLGFQIDGATGAIDGAMAGHMESCPEPIPDDA